MGISSYKINLMARYFTLIILFITLSTASFAQKTINSFLEKYRQAQNVALFDALKMLSEHKNDSTTPEQWALIKKLKTVQVMSIQFDENNKDSITDDIIQLKTNLLKNKYEELTSFKSGNSKSIAMAFLPDNKPEKDYVQIIEDSGSALIIHMAGEMTANEFSKVVASLNISSN